MSNPFDPCDIDLVSKVSDLVNGERNDSYGHPYFNFSSIADMWTALLRRKYPLVKFTPEDVALFMVCVKLSREYTKPGADNILDAMGYLECHSMIGKMKEIIKGTECNKK